MNTTERRQQVNKQRKIPPWVIGCTAVLIALLLAFLLFVPRLINLEPIREKILANISRTLGGKVECQRVDLSFLPRPRVLVHQPSLSVPGKLTGDIESVVVYPKILPLLTAKVRLAKLRFEAPALTVKLGEKKEKEERQGTPSVADLEQEIAAALALVASKTPGLVVVVKNGRLDLSQENRSVFQSQDIDARISLPPKRIKLRISCESDLWESVSLKGWLDVRNSTGSETTLMGQSSPRVSLELEGKEVDVPSTREAALALVGNIPITQKIFRIVKGGKVPLITFHTHGNSLADLGKSENIRITGRMRDGKISVARADMDFEEVNGKVVISQGVLEGSNVEARLENAWGRQGALRLGLKGKDAPFHLEAEIETNLVELPPLLKRFVKNMTFQEEIARIHDIRGKALGRLILGESVRSIKASADVSEFNLSANYERMPYALEIHGGRFSYDKTRIDVEKLTGKLGRSSFSKLSAGLEWGTEPHLEVKSAILGISLEEIYPWLASFQGLRHALKDPEAVKGTVALSALSLNGPLFTPKNWHIQMGGEVKDLAVNTALFPKPIVVTKAKFEAISDELSFTGLQTNILDASLNGTGVLNGYLEGLQKADVTFSGKMGPESTRWASGVVNCPSGLNVRSPLSISRAHLTWARGEKTSFKGDLSVQDGPKVSIDIDQNPEELIIKHLLIEDQESHASLKLNLEKRMFGLQFVGHLTNKTIDDLVMTDQFSTGWIKGDFQAQALMDQPMRSTAQGSLKAEDLVFPCKANVPVKIDSLSLDAQGNNLRLDSAILIGGDNRMALEGDVSYSAAGFLFDMDLSADTIEWDHVKSILEKEDGKREGAPDQNLWDLPVQGKLTLNTEHFQYNQFTWTPLRADISFTPKEVNVSVSEADLCGISTPGILRVTPQDVSMDFEYVSKNQELEPTVACLGNKGGAVTGKFDFKGQIAACGKGEALPRSLQGNLEFIANNGHIYRYGVLAKVLAFVNLTEVFRGKVPDLTKEGFAYDSMTAKGTIQDGKLLLREGLIDGSSMEIACHGDIDLVKKEMDLKLLVAPLKTADFIVKKIPLVRHILGGTLVSIPVGVAGDLADPTVSPLSASAAGSRLLEIMERTVELPVKIIESLPSAEKQE